LDSQNSSVASKGGSQSPRNKYFLEIDKAYFIMEIVAFIWFAMEYILRLYSTRLKILKFILKPLNLIDMISNLIFIEIIVTNMINVNVNDNWKIIPCIFQIFRIIRVITTSDIIKAVVFTVKKSLKELILLITLNFSSGMFLGSLIYLAEKDAPDTQFDSLPASFYWGVNLLF
jgi:hypothetical protein